ncbi:hypothetical protein MJG53_009707 [Ovis ammon polii x Ovis aries]|uniref:Uncharacterized protein n=1 Tax=Ovis ammon polii x Ovis aries TaxID=2918886 RepID=A0ACB9UX48_9CETA|nr:hypothetical protein MJG53_009707 [Ovis ammon polii x Ovis aries]
MRGGPGPWRKRGAAAREHGESVQGAAGDCGDHVVIMNTRHIAFSGNKWEQKVYSSHTGAAPPSFRYAVFCCGRRLLQGCVAMCCAECAVG